MNNQIFDQYKKRIVIALIMSFILIGGLVYFLNRPGTLTVTTVDGAEISVANEKGGEFKKIGVGTATYKTRKVPLSVYIRVTKDDNKTISTAYVERGKKTSKTLEIGKQVQAKPLISGSVFNAILSGQTLQGIIPEQFTLSRTLIGTTEPNRLEFLSMPYVNKVVWYDLDNFVYVNFKGGVGKFSGKNLGAAAIGTSITGRDLDSVEAVESDENISIKDIAKSDQKPLVLVSSTNLFTSNDGGSSLVSIARFEEEERTTKLFADNQFIYRAIIKQPAEYDDEEADIKDDKRERTTDLYQYDYSGKQVGKYSIADASITAVTSRDNTVFVLSPAKLSVISDKTLESSDVYFTFAQDLVSYKGRVVLLGDDGLWEIGKDNVSSQLLFGFGSSGVGLKNSLSTSGNQLIFGTQPRPGDEDNNTQLFVTSF